MTDGNAEVRAASLAQTVGEDVGDDEQLLRRIHWSQVKEGRPSSSAFKDVEMSVDRAALLNAPLDALLEHPGHGVATLVAKTARELGQEVIPDPIDLFKPAHALVKGKKTDSIARKLARSSELLKAPSPPPLSKIDGA